MEEVECVSELPEVRENGECSQNGMEARGAGVAQVSVAAVEKR